MRSGASASRMRALLATGLASTLLAAASPPAAAYASCTEFVAPSAAMAPTFHKGDRLNAQMQVPRQLTRGDVVLVAMGRGIFIKRVAGLPGDTIEMVRGVVLLNGERVLQKRIGEQIYGARSPRRVTRLSEQFPGEGAPHEIFDAGYFPALDDVPRVLVPAGHVYLLGDNRDDSIDSRSDGLLIPIAGPAPITKLRGRVCGPGSLPEGS